MQNAFAPRARSIAMLAAALALSAIAALAGAPAAGAGAHAHALDWRCSLVESPDIGLFGRLAAPTSSGIARGDGAAREPDLDQVAVDAPPTRGRPAAGIVVPTYVHVITPDGVTGNVPTHKIKEQIAVLDQTFAGGRGGAATPFDFELVGITRTINEAWYLTGSKAEHEMKQALRQGGPDALNMYLTTAGPYLGWAYLPSILDTRQAYLDGVVIDWETLPNVSDTYEGRFDLGFTATHEVGHWLNLLHTFDGACGQLGDRVADTPAELTPTSRCPAGKDSCTQQPGLDPIHNYMDYSDDPCYTEFTAGQASRMLDAWNFWRG